MVRTGNPTPKTTLRSSNLKRRGQAGFTLIEIIIVLTIISLVMSLGLPAISRVTYQQVNSTTRKMIGLVHTIRNDCILLNNVYRLAFDFENKTYWVESQKSFQLLASDDELEAKKKKRKKGEPDPADSNFVFAKKFSAKPIPFPGGVAFEGVLKEREGLIREGVAYIYFFPNGYNEQAIIYVNKDGAKSKGYSLLLRPTLGKVEIFKGEIASFTATP